MVDIRLSWEIQSNKETVALTGCADRARTTGLVAGVQSGEKKHDGSKEQNRE